MSLKHDLATAAQALQRRDATGAISALRSALTTDPTQAEAWYNLGFALRATSAFDDALSAYQAALDNGIAHPEEAHVNRAVILMDHLFQPEAAEREIAQALEINPDFIPALINKGTLAEDRGDSALARSVYEHILTLEPQNGRALLRTTMIDIALGKPSTAMISRLEEALPKPDQLPDSLIDIAFALANAYDAEGRYIEAFDLVLKANSWDEQLRPTSLRYHPTAHEALVRQICQKPPAATCSNICDGPQMVFICGLFRSGSTLTEQLIGRHTAITPGGERDMIPQLVEARINPYPTALDRADVATLNIWREAYLSGYTAEERAARILTDKRCDNFLHIGLIKALFPTAKIIHTVRDPRDILISTLFLRFGSGVNYGSSIETFMHWYSQYLRVMAHWTEYYGKDIITLDYDFLVRQPKLAVRQVLDEMGLPWEDQCLVPSKNETVKTASSWQVRQSVHPRSSGRWKNYEKRLPKFFGN